MNRRSFFKRSILFLGLSLFQLKQALSDSSVFLKEKFKSLHLPDDDSFFELKKIFNTLINKADPLAILQPSDLLEASKTINEDSLKKIPILMRSGGHSYAGFCTGPGLVIDSRKLKKIECNQNSVILGSGLMLKEAQDTLKKKNYTFASGEFPGVGLAGYMLGGGHSKRSRYLGLGADSVKSMSVLLASGERLKEVSPYRYRDLFWALLGGGGGNFAFVESFEIEKIPSFQDYFFKFTFPASLVNQSNDILRFWENQIQKDPDHIGVNTTLYIQNGYITKLIVSGVIMDVNNNIEELDRAFMNNEWYELSKMKPTKFESKITDSNFIRRSNMKNLYFMGTSHYADRNIGSDGFGQLKESIKHYTKDSNLYMGLYSMGGKINSPERSISYPHRQAKYMVDIFSNFREDKTKHELFRSNFINLQRSLNPIFSGRGYINYPNIDLNENWPARYYGESLDKLIKVKKKYDPENRLDFGEHCISRLV